MTEAEIVEQFIKVQKSSQHVEIHVDMIRWEGAPDIPWTETVLAKSMPLNASEAEVSKTIQKLLKTRKYFRVCKECGELNPVGWMNAFKDICDGCAEQNHGVVF